MNKKLTFSRHNAKGTGADLEIELVPERGMIFKIVPQSGNFRPPAGQGGIAVLLGFEELCLILQVFIGECESLCEGRGIYRRDRDEQTVVRLRHIIECDCGYALEMYRNTTGRPEDDLSAHFFIRSADALGLTRVIENSLAVIAFGNQAVG